MKHFLLLCALLAFGCLLHGQIQTDVLGSHDLSIAGQSPSPIKGNLPACQFCHAPHSGISNVQGLWSQKLSTATYTLYSNSTMVNQVQQPTLGGHSNLCLSCHDGTVAPGQSTPYGNTQMTGSMSSQDVFGTNLQNVHPFNFKLPLQNAPNLLPSIVANGTTGNPSVKLVDGNVECITCHDPHTETVDPVQKDFLVTDNSGSQLCLACHISAPSQATFSALKSSTTLQRSSAVPRNSPQPTGGPTSPNSTVSSPRSNEMLRMAQSHRTASVRISPVLTVAGQYNPFNFWSSSIHATATHKVVKGKKLGPYGNMKQNGCLSCHKTHDNGHLDAAANANNKLLTTFGMPTATIAAKTNLQAATQIDATTNNCISCHDGDSNLTPPVPNVLAEFQKTGHPFPTEKNSHILGEGAILNNNRHTTCVDCHEPHSSLQSVSFAPTTIRGSQNGVVGVSADGTTVVNPAANQYENCLRCHGTSAGKEALGAFGYLPVRVAADADPLNLIPQFSSAAKSTHPVMRDRNSVQAQPSLLKFMWNLDGHTQGRAIASRILCTDCHNADDNREFGGSGPNGPHGSKFSHILERRYEYSQVGIGTPPAGGPGTTIQNLLPVVTDPAADGPYSICAKCHDLSNVMSDVSFNKHSRHIKAGFSCSVCHTAHGMNGSPAISGERLVNFDVTVVAPNDTANTPISYSHATNTCVLKCHNFNHNVDGTVTVSASSKGAVTRSIGTR